MRGCRRGSAASRRVLFPLVGGEITSRLTETLLKCRTESIKHGLELQRCTNGAFGHRKQYLW